MISAAMQRALKGPRRTLCWLFWFEGDSSDLYVWNGVHTITWAGVSYVGAGHIAAISTIKKTEAIEHTEQQFTLNGLDPNVLGGLGLSVRGKSAKIWLAALDRGGQVIADPILISELVQDTLQFDRAADDTLTLTLTTFEALPFVGKASKGKYSNESQLAKYPGDTGFKYTASIALAGPAVKWQQG